MSRIAAVTRVGTLLRLPVFVHFSVPLAMVLVLAFHSYAIAQTLGWIVGGIIVILTHELGHAALVKICGQRVEYLTIYGWGGECAFTQQGLSPLRHSVIAWGGVLAQGVVLVPMWLLAEHRWVPSNIFVVGIFQYLLIGNVLLIGFNLIPWPGLDGHRAWPLPYHLVRSLLRTRRAKPRASSARPRERQVDRRGLRVIDGGKDDA